MSTLRNTRPALFAATTAFAALSLSTPGRAQTVPTNTYSIKTSRGTYTGKMVGGSPFLTNPSPVTIDAVLIPLIIQIIKPDGTVTTFDPTQPDTCDGGYSAEYRFKHSPLVVPSDLIFNGVDVGKVQYIDGFMRAQFWNVPAPGAPNRASYFNPLDWSFASPYLLPALTPDVAIVNNSGCDETGVVSKPVLNEYIKTFALPLLQASGVISTTKFALFLTKNVSGANNFSATPSGFVAGEHFVTGNQTWARAQYQHTSKSQTDVLTASHEIAEWMNDPFVNNPAPAWGDEGEVGAGTCAYKFEVGDPVNGIAVPITMGSYEYHLQELAFFSWFFNPPDLFSYGAGGKFSSKGRFTGPSKNCPSGGTY